MDWQDSLTNNSLCQLNAFYYSVSHLSTKIIVWILDKIYGLIFSGSGRFNCINLADERMSFYKNHISKEPLQIVEILYWYTLDIQ